MVMHIQVCLDGIYTNDYRVFGRAEYQPGEYGVEFNAQVRKQKGMTAAEAVEWYLMNHHNLVASWVWSKSKDVLYCDFVHGNPNGERAYKEVKYSQAHEFDL